MSELIRCKLCLMPTTRASLQFDDEGVCESCRLAERKVDWSERWVELKELCDKHRGKKPYDMVIPLSGGKDSHAQLYYFKKVLNMNPLGVMIDNASWTETGRANFQNISKVFDIDIITFTPSVQTMIEKSRQGFFEDLWPEKYWDHLLYLKPLEIAKSFGIEFVAWGEDRAGFSSEESSSALKLLPEYFRDTFKGMDVIFLGYYIPWSRYLNLKIAKAHGFKDLDDTGEWTRWGLEDYPYEQIDTIGYLTNNWLKFIKFGFGTATEIESESIREKKTTREIGLKRAIENDWKLDPEMQEDFCEGLGITQKDFWVTIDNFANKNLLEKRDGWWRLKRPLE